MSSGAGSWGEFSEEFPSADELLSALPCGRSAQGPEQPFDGHLCGQGDPPCCSHGPACHKGGVVEKEKEAAPRGSRDPERAHPLLRQDHRLYLGGELRRYEQRDRQPRQDLDDEASSVSARLLPGGTLAGDVPAAPVSVTVPQVQSKPKTLPTTKSKKKSTSKSRPSPSSSSSVKSLTATANIPPQSDIPKRYRYHYAFTSRRDEEEEESERPYFEVMLDNDDSPSNGSCSSAASYRSAYGGRGRLWRKMKRSKTKLTAERSGSGTELLVFTFFLVVMMLTLSQVLVVHHKYNGHYSSSGGSGGEGSGSGPPGGRSARLQYQQEVRMVDRSIAALRRRNLPSPKQAAEDLQKDVFEKRIARLILKAEQESADSLHLGAGSDQAPVNVSDQSTRELSAMPSSRPLSVSSWRSSSVVLGRLPPSSSVSLSLSELRTLSTSSIIPSFQSSRTLSSDIVSSAFDSVNVSRANLSSSLLDDRSLAVKSTLKNSPQHLKTPLMDLILIGTNSSKILPESVLPRNVSSEGNDTEGGGYGYDEVDGDRPKMEGRAENLTLRDGGPRTGNFTIIAFPVRPFCKEEPPILLGNVSGDVNREHKTLTLAQVQAWHKDLAPGGEWRPPGCVARYRLAVVIPYRDRLAHLTVLLAHLLPILKRQQLHFRIFVVEQSGNLTFNKGRIMNAAFKEALKMYDFQCVVFHDVDLIPEDDRNMYSCPVMPRHMSVAVDEMNYTLSYGMLVGGVLNMRVEHFQHVNGYSNMYWGWGAEDDDMAYRILHVGLKIFRPPSKIARYQMIKHVKRKATSWSIRGRLLRTAVKRYHLDGLNSVQYSIKFIHTDPLYTHLMVDIGKPDMPIDQR